MSEVAAFGWTGYLSALILFTLSLLKPTPLNYI